MPAIVRRLKVSFSRDEVRVIAQGRSPTGTPFVLTSLRTKHGGDPKGTAVSLVESALRSAGYTELDSTT